MKEINYLKENGTIALVATSFGCKDDPYYTRLKASINNLKNDGFKINESKYIFENNSKYLLAASPKKLANEFMKQYLSKENNILISVGGGEMMCEILPYINFDKLKKAPSKLFMGFSDNTNLTYTMTTICDLVTIYGVNAPSFAFHPYQYDNLDSLLLMTNRKKIFYGYPYWERNKIKSDNPLEKSNFNEIKKLKIYSNQNEINVNGILLGGCLDCLVTLCGTKFDKTKEFVNKHKEEGIIFFLEACDLNPIQIKRALFQLKNANWFDYCKAFIIGRPLCYKQKYFNIDHYKAFKEELKEFNVPLIMDADLGHFSPSMPLLCGAKANVMMKNDNIIVSYED